MGRHTLLVLVENKPGVLARVAALFARRRYNIDSLDVEPMEHVRLSRMTIVVDIGRLRIDQVVSQIDKLVNVLEVEEAEEVGAAGAVADLPPQISVHAADRPANAVNAANAA